MSVVGVGPRPRSRLLRRTRRAGWPAAAVALSRTARAVTLDDSRYLPSGMQLGVSVIDQGLPTLTGFIKADLGLTAAVAGLTVSSFAIGKIFGAYAAGVAADRFGERRVLILGSFVAAALVAVAAATPFPAFTTARRRDGGVASTPAGGRLVLLAFPRNRHGLALASGRRASRSEG